MISSTESWFGEFALAVPFSWGVAPQISQWLIPSHHLCLFSSYRDQEDFPDYHCHFLFPYSDLLSLEHLSFYVIYLLTHLLAHNLSSPLDSIHICWMKRTFLKTSFIFLEAPLPHHRHMDWNLRNQSASWQRNPIKGLIMHHYNVNLLLLLGMCDTLQDAATGPLAEGHNIQVFF